MKQKSGPDKAPAEQVLKDIRRQTRRQYSAEEKIRIVLEGLRGRLRLDHNTRDVAVRPCQAGCEPESDRISGPRNNGRAHSVAMSRQSRG
jgi:hypothetical protein